VKQIIVFEQTKFCSRYKKDMCSGSNPLPLSEFAKNKSRPDGLNSQCKSCSKESRRKYLYESGGLEKARKQSADYYELVKSDLLLYEKRNKRMADWRVANDVSRISNARRKAIVLGQMGIVPQDAFEILISIFGESCMYPSCGLAINEKNKLHIDHVIPLSWGSENTRLHDINNMQILCAFHNFSKGAWNANDYRPFKYSMEDL
jgi:hypothetical protein